MTPGPWRYDSGKIWTPRGWWVASVYEDMEEDIKRANGLLLAAAPDLLEACRALLDLELSGLRGPDDEDYCHEVQLAIDAIAKARGEK